MGRSLGGYPASVLAAAGAFVALVGVPAPVDAAERVALFSFEGFDLPKAVEMAPFGLSNLVARRLADAGYEVVEPVLTLRDMMVAMECEGMDDDCGRRIAAHSETAYVIVGKLTGEGGLAPGIRIQLRVHFADGKPTREVDEMVAGSLSELTAEFERLAALVVVRVSAPSASMEDIVSAAARKSVRPTTAIGIAAIGVGIAALAVGAAMSVRWFRARDTYRSGLEPYLTGEGDVPVLPVNDYFDETRDLCQDGDDRLTTEVATELADVFLACDRLKSSAVVGWVAGVSGAVLAAAGVVLVAMPKPAGSAKAKPKVRVVPSIAPDFAGASVSVAF